MTAPDREATAPGAPADAFDGADGVDLARHVRGDRSGFVALVERHGEALAAFLHRMTGSADRAQDLTQEAFVRLFERPPSATAASGSLRPWLFRVALNVLRSEERRRKVADLARPLLELVGGQGWRAPSPEDDVAGRDAGRQVAAALAALPPEYRAVVVLHDVEERRYEDIASLLGCPVGTVRSRLHRGRALLERRLLAAATHEVPA